MLKLWVQSLEPKEVEEEELKRKKRGFRNNRIKGRLLSLKLQSFIDQKEILTW